MVLSVSGEARYGRFSTAAELMLAAEAGVGGGEAHRDRGCRI
jgi:hypothetical protein